MHYLNKLIQCVFVVACFFVCLTGCENSQPMLVTQPEEQSLQSENEVEEDSSLPPEQMTQTDSETYFAVYVCGAVKTPGVYYLRNIDLKDDAIKMAGGFLEEADTTYVNLAQKVTEGERIYVPTKEETAQGIHQNYDDESALTAVQTETGKININTAEKEMLMTLPGIGESKAQAILAYRQEHGGFQSIDELMNIRGIKEGVYNKIKDLIVVN